MLFHRMRFTFRGPGEGARADGGAIAGPDGGALAAGTPRRPPGVRLTPREREALLWAARGRSARETAQLLGLSERTVKFFVQRACARLDARNKTHAVAKALVWGLIRP